MTNYQGNNVIKIRFNILYTLIEIIFKFYLKKHFNYNTNSY